MAIAPTSARGPADTTRRHQGVRARVRQMRWKVGDGWASVLLAAWLGLALGFTCGDGICDIGPGIGPDSECVACPKDCWNTTAVALGQAPSQCPRPVEPCFLANSTNVCREGTLIGGCATEACVPMTGACTLFGVDALCDGAGNACLDTVCDTGFALVGPDDSYCTDVARECSDGNPCTIDHCDGQDGCFHLPACDDSDQCTADECVLDADMQFSCRHSAISCNDDVNCTIDSCNPLFGCLHQTDHHACVDGDACTIDSCNRIAGCQHFPVTCIDFRACTTDSCDPVRGCFYTPITCDDGVACTTDTCIEDSGGCQFTVNATACDDGDECTNDLCDPVQGCLHSSIDCDDGNACTVDSCDAGTGCSNVAVDGLLCDDGNPCTLNDTCVSGACVAGAPRACDDGNVCTSDSCDAVLGCVSANNTLACDDGDACTLGDVCAQGVCTPGTGALDCSGMHQACRFGHCDTVLGCELVDRPDGTLCLDSDVCNGNETCSSGLCLAAADILCDDDDPCTEDSCAAGIGCVFDAISNCSPCDLDADCPRRACHVGVCDQSLRCQYVPQQGANVDMCQDGSVCNGMEICDASGACAAGPAGPLSCDDGNECTDDQCDPLVGCVHNNATRSCDDANACTSDDACHAGQCVGVAAVRCDDGNVCTDDVCDPGVGCQFLPNSAPCQDGNACTSNDTCVQGSCHPGPAVTCDDGNVCTSETCSIANGCVSTPTDAACDDGNACTLDDRCSDSVCQPGVARDCDDGNVCTIDTCDPVIGCVHEPSTGSACDDANACTFNDTCVAGVCQAGPAAACDDGNACTSNTCDPLLGCQVLPLTGVTCDDGDLCTSTDRCVDGQCVGFMPADCSPLQDVCNDAVCDPTQGCIKLPHSNSTDCGDGDVCNGAEVCQAGECVAGLPLDCDDGNACTSDSCDYVLGCIHVGLPDCHPCISEEGNGACPVLPCQSSECVADICVYSLDNAAVDACPQQDECDGAAVCVAGACSLAPPLDCDDGNACTEDACEPTLGCIFAPVADGSSCSDGDACNGEEVCASGECRSGQAATCASSDPCVEAACLPRQGCVLSNTTASCDDGNRCTSNDTCTDGMCRGSEVSCDDGNACTTDVCDGSIGCVFTPILGCFPCQVDADGAECPDLECRSSFCDSGVCMYVFNNNATQLCPQRDVCFGQAICESGACGFADPPTCDDGNACTQDQCVPGTGCVNAPLLDGAFCGDSDVCNGNETCAAGMCQPGTAPVCSDGNACTQDSCDPLLGCVFLPQPGVCDDGDACTLGDVCDGGACVPGTPITCEDDGNVCTDVTCDAVLGCVVRNNTAACDDGDACTLGDQCRDGVCAGGDGVLTCDDGNACTDDRCDRGVGCVHTNNTAGCSDGNVCTLGDRCGAGVCQAGVDTLDCSALTSQCVMAACDATAGCVAVPLSGVPCSDGNACDGEGRCADGVCVMQLATRLVCDDSNSCTIDACTNGTCIHTDVVCDDDNACTLDACDPSVGCTSVAMDDDVCDDGDVCTQDACDPVLGCVNVPHDAMKCDDGNVCTDDVCDAVLGCLHIPNTLGCDDGDACGVVDQCRNGTCAATQVIDCDDGNPCTRDLCRSDEGCVYMPDDSASCDDGDPCTIRDWCEDGVCVSSNSHPCPDISFLRGMHPRFDISLDGVRGDRHLNLLNPLVHTAMHEACSTSAPVWGCWGDYAEWYDAERGWWREMPTGLFYVSNHNHIHVHDKLNRKSHWVDKLQDRCVRVTIRCGEDKNWQCVAFAIDNTPSSEPEAPSSSQGGAQCGGNKATRAHVMSEMDAHNHAISTGFGMDE